MGGEYLFATFFVLACVLTCKGEECETYDGNGICIPPCSHGRILFSADCLKPTMSERTCRQPDPRSLGTICDYIRCECPGPKVWDEVTKKCVMLAECSEQKKKAEKDGEKNGQRGCKKKCVGLSVAQG